MPSTKPRAPALYSIIVIKLIKGLIFLTVAWVAYALSDNDLPAEFRNLLHWLRLNPERQFFTFLAVQIGKITEANVLWVAAGTLFYSLFSLVEGIGLMFRVSWASWMAIGESALFIPVEILELVHKFSWTVSVILILNLFIFWYLLLNRKRLFHKVHFHRHSREATSCDSQVPSPPQNHCP
jgi:uncharacterized membrane protein (DUF2068 family)